MELVAEVKIAYNILSFNSSKEKRPHGTKERGFGAGWAKIVSTPQRKNGPMEHDRSKTHTKKTCQVSTPQRKNGPMELLNTLFGHILSFGFNSSKEKRPHGTRYNPVIQN